MKRYSDLDVRTCHSYEIHYKHRYECTNVECAHVYAEIDHRHHHHNRYPYNYIESHHVFRYGRHSASIDISRQRCGKCRSSLRSLGVFNADGTLAKPRKASAFSLYIKEHYKVAKKQLPHASHQTLMSMLADEYKLQKERNSKY